MERERVRLHNQEGENQRNQLWDRAKNQDEEEIIEEHRKYEGGHRNGHQQDRKKYKKIQKHNFASDEEKSWHENKLKYKKKKNKHERGRKYERGN